MKANTVDQFKILKHIDDNFLPGYVDLEIVDERSIRVTDKVGDTLLFRIEDGKLVELP